MPSKKGASASLPRPALDGAVPCSIRPIDSALHPIETGSYRIATPAIPLLVGKSHCIGDTRWWGMPCSKPNGRALTSTEKVALRNEIPWGL